MESEKTARIAKREENINVKKLGKAPSTPAGEEKAGEKVGAGSGRPRLGFPKPGSQSDEGGKTSIRSATGPGGDKNKGTSNYEMTPLCCLSVCHCKRRAVQEAWSSQHSHYEVD